MKKVVILLVIICISGLYSCKECRTCIGYKNGIGQEYENCSYGFPPSRSALDSWDDYLLEIEGCDSVKCN